MIYAATRALPRCSSSVEAEALACLAGLEAGADKVQMPIILETDNAEVAAAIQKRDATRSAWWPIIQESLAIMDRLVQVQVHNVKRGCNRVAHELAKLVQSSGIDTEWILQSPPSVLTLLNQECNPLFSD